jgi:Ni,Fe-hydrogenase III small subunit/formate hydrogenlyase subunit 6/NADH:ubiquinone oxidoreductase subunit I
MLKIAKKVIEHRIVTNNYPFEDVKVGPDFLGRIQGDSELCTGCRTCIAHCPTGAIRYEDGIKVNLGQCIFCGLCIEACPSKALKPDNHYENALSDKSLFGPFDDTSEPMTQDIEVIGKRMEKRIKEHFGRSLNIREVDAGSCNGCDNEVSIMNNPFNDLERFGIHFVASPRHADMLLVTGCASRNMEEALIKTYNATPDPKLVMAVGTCAISGGIFKESYAVRGGIDTLIPVDIYVPGCPPRPQAIMYGIFKLIGRVDR